ncbi:MAG: putative manganese-dependent inorganic diphosphatase [Lachnospiraceae bacterium]|nr:putative manganese-dependent inorganic diphosphatase [Lachnospiraceae bacterium]
MPEENRPILVIGHINPDTDSICSAICYARLKETITGKKHEARRAGQINEETRFVLSKFGVKEPEYQDNVRMQVKDVEYRETEGVSRNISLKRAWEIMKEKNVVTLPITKQRRLEGLITVKDIATSYMDVYDSRILSTAHTKYKNIVETLDATMLVGNPEEYFIDGKVLIAAANPEIMENYIEDNDLVILGNRYESQLSAIEMNAGCIVVCEGAVVATSIKKLAEENGCNIICTPHDTYTVARLINQSMPISYFMTREDLVTFCTDDYIDDIRDIMAKMRHRDFPVLDKKGTYMGMMSRRNLLGTERKKVILVDHNEKSQAVDGIEDAEIMEIIDHHRLGTIETISPVYFRNQPLGCTATIVYQMYTENNVKIDKQTASLLCAAIISDTLMYRSPTCTEFDKLAAKELSKIADLDVESFAAEMFKAGSNLSKKSEEEIFYQDFKKFSSGDISFGVGQITSMNEEELSVIKGRMLPYIKNMITVHNIDMIYFMLTDIQNESTELLFAGNHAQELVANAFAVQFPEGDDIASANLKGVVSRKKQLIPALMKVMQQ